MGGGTINFRHTAWRRREKTSPFWRDFALYKSLSVVSSFSLIFPGLVST